MLDATSNESVTRQLSEPAGVTLRPVGRRDLEKLRRWRNEMAPRTELKDWPLTPETMRLWFARQVDMAIARIIRYAGSDIGYAGVKAHGEVSFYIADPLQRRP